MSEKTANLVVRELPAELVKEMKKNVRQRNLFWGGWLREQISRLFENELKPKSK